MNERERLIFIQRKCYLLEKCHTYFGEQNYVNFKNEVSMKPTRTVFCADNWYGDSI